MLMTLAQAAATDFNHYAALGVLLLIAIGFGIAAVFATVIIGPNRDGAVKGAVYESGMNPWGTARRRFNVRFYMVAMTFLLFDVEIAFLYPWAVTYPSLDPESGLGGVFLGRLLFFLLTSVIAFAYAWRKGVFKYD
ncbi:NADH-quinone oxidoreductase subunit A [Mucisphaera calidilacus]|nr:NADH-quinone oxidoreductase subunit A [Mucisphaera calidilacus]